MPRKLLFISAAITALCLGACDQLGAKGSAIRAARSAVGNPNARVEGVRENWTPTYQKAVCGRIEVGVEQRRFVALLISDGTAMEPMIEGANLDDKKAFEETIWRPICGF